MPITKFEIVNLESGQTKTVDFGSSIINASVAVQAFKVAYGSSDNHVREIDVQAALSSFSGSRVTVNATCTMHDDSNNKGEGTVDALVIAECES